MNTFDKRLNETPVGGSFLISPSSLAMDDHAFHDFVDNLLRQGGGSGFVISQARRESMSGDRLYHRAMVTRTDT